MKIEPKELRRLSNLELSIFSGENLALEEWDLIHARALYQTPVEVTMIAEEGICDRGLYRLCLYFEGEHDTFAGLRVDISERLAQTFQPPNWMKLTVIFDGIYVGNPEDIYNSRAGQPELIQCPMKGLGTKLADITFL
ncbi:MAG: hypothetical protein PHF67_00520 [Candidatus Nanoarchaeia archaeon]|nr:hypothetical protein [Candidatus Nanoarchaeia archaeon]